MSCNNCKHFEGYECKEGYGAYDHCPIRDNVSPDWYDKDNGEDVWNEISPEEQRKRNQGR